MFRSLYTAAAGAVAQQQGIDVTANNLANVSTQGYRPDRATFADLVRTGVRSGEDAPTTGSGAKLDGTDTLYGASAGLLKTGRPLDFALTDSRSFFAVRTAGGVRYTKAGAFAESAGADGRFYLTDAQGAPVLDARGQRIEVADGEPAAGPGVFTFPNLGGLRKEGDNDFAPTALSGQAEPAAGTEVKRGYLEGSGSDFVDGMSELIAQERAFQLDTRMVQMSDEVAQTVNSLR